MEYGSGQAFERVEQWLVYLSTLALIGAIALVALKADVWLGEYAYFGMPTIAVVLVALCIFFWKGVEHVFKKLRARR